MMTMQYLKSKTIGVIITIMWRKKYRPHKVQPIAFEINQSLDVILDRRSLAINLLRVYRHQSNKQIASYGRRATSKPYPRLLTWNRSPRWSGPLIAQYAKFHNLSWISNFFVPNVN